MSAVNNLKVNGNLNSINGSSSPSSNTNTNSTINNQFSNNGQQSTAVKLQHHHHSPLSYQPSANSKGKNIVEGPVQQQTIATVHHHHQYQPQHQLTVEINQQRRNPHILSSIQNNTSHTIIPPRYQPPPQPAGGILKHLNPSSNERLVNKSSGYFVDLHTTSPHLNIKYPPEIPQLSAVYIPESIKTQENSTKYIQHQSRHRVGGGSGGAHLVLNSQQKKHQQQQQQQQQHQQQQHLKEQQKEQEMLKFVRKSDQDQSSPNTPTTTPTGIPSTAGRLTAEQNRQLQSLITELRVLKEANQRLIDDNQELRDLCCFLDDDRQKGRKLAREWQRFGRYTASVMRQEVSAYQNKLRQLDDKQQELITDNLELKELCLYLDEERAHVAANTLCLNCGAPARPPLRDDGDGSSSSTNADETISAIRNYERNLPDLHMRTTLSDQTLQYVRSLERRIHQLEEERLGGLATCATAANTVASSQVTPTPEAISGRPEAVVRALQVLEVREQLERDRLLTGAQIDQMDDGEKAIVREMCNVVWRKLEGSPNGPNGMEPL